MTRMRGTDVASVMLLFLLLVSGADGQPARSDHQLIEAVKQADIDAVRSLLEDGVDVDALEPDGATALHWAANRGDSDLVRLLLEGGADVQAENRYGVRPLSLACASGNASVIQQLLDAGADVNHALVAGETPLLTAARTATAEVIGVLVSHGADPNVREPVRGQTPLMWAAAAGNVEAIGALLAGGSDLFALSEEHDFRSRSTGNGGARRPPEGPMIEFSPLMFAVRNGHLGAVRTLLDAGADPNGAIPDGTAALLVAIINAHWELAGYLIDRGADPNGMASGWAPLHQLARSRSLTVGHVPHPVETGTLSSLDLGRKLLESGADVNAQVTSSGMLADGYRTKLPQIGNTPYMLAAKGVDHELMRVLLDHGADPLLTNEVGMRPLMVAAGVALHSPGEDTGTHEDALEAVQLAYSVDPDVSYTDQRGHNALHGAARRGVVPILRFLIENSSSEVLGATVLRDDFIGQTYGDRGFAWTPLTIALGRQRDGRPIFLGEERMLPAAAVIYQAMLEKDVPVDEHEASLEDVKRLIAESGR